MDTTETKTPARGSGKPQPELAPAAKVKVKVAPGHSLVVSRHKSGFAVGNKMPGDVVELDAAEAKRLKKRGVVIDADAELPHRATGLAIDQASGPRVQGPEFSRKPDAKK